MKANEIKDLSNEDILKLYRQTGNNEYLDLLYEKVKLLIYDICHKNGAKVSRTCNLDFEEVLSIANTAFMKTVLSYKIDKNTQFSTLLYTYILYAFGLTYRTYNKRKKELYLDSITTNISCRRDLEQQVSITELLADENVNLEEDTVKSLDLEHNKVTLAKIFGLLSEKQRTILTCFYFENKTLEEIGSIVGMIPSSVTRLKRGALDILREILEDPKAIEKVKAKASKNTQGLPKNYKDYLYLLSDREKTVLLGRVNNKSYKAIGEEIGSGSSTAISVLYTAIKKVEQAALDPLDSKKSIKPCIFYGQMYKKHHKYLSELTELDQQVLGLKYKQHMTVAQIMKILNKPKATANSCITNAERRFKKLLVKKGVIS